jgi:hypothetical protein
VVAALRPAIVLSAVVPVVVLRGGDGVAAIVLGSYATIVVVLTIVGAALGWAQGLSSIAIALALVAGDRFAHALADARRASAASFFAR